ncbi:unnamed protein product [Nippostrongylus brasiliensis]|uniref:SCP domain-containing protein n=1 Tax=Nippostrongylus brasiliensis TaxID=27835 RepID=A0A158QWF8_NIPBR|nr:unnamed protein product [Nippostrongylus brasiliensis]
MVIAVTADPNVYQCSGLGMTPEERQSVLTMYNIARGKTATGTYFRTGTKLPTAKNMRALTWDCELEKLAEKSALTCDDRPLPVPYYAYNFRFMLASIPNKLSALEPAVQPTEDPSGGFTTQSSSVVYNGNPIYKNYANIMRSDTSKIGCSVRVCGRRGVIVQIGVCVFDTPEMEKGGKVYEVGKPCQTSEECPHGDDVCVGQALCYRNKFAKRSLHLHNKRRSELALGNVKYKSGKNFETASLMLELALSFDLEAQALKAALNWERDPTGWSSHLYSVYDTWTSRIVIENAVDEIDALEQALKTWWNQRKLVDDQVKKVLFENAFIQPAVMEFVQMATGQNSLVGCAADKRGNQYNVVCQYHVGIGAPTPEESFMPLYFIGKPCLAPCDDNRKCSKGMCPSLSSRTYRIFTNFSPTDFFD